MTVRCKWFQTLGSEPTENENEKKNDKELIDAASTIIAVGMVAGLIGLAAWCFGMEPKLSLGVSIVAFFVFLSLQN